MFDIILILALSFEAQVSMGQWLLSAITSLKSYCFFSATVTFKFILITYPKLAALILHLWQILDFQRK